MNTPTSDLVVTGGGIVGLATAFRYTERYPGQEVTVLEKEAQVAQHQSGRNSGVLHSGIYYQPGSLKATNCRQGKLAMERFCSEHGVPYEVCGKVIVAVDQSELAALRRIQERGEQNGVACEQIGPERLAEIEPHARGVAALHVPEAGIVDYPAVCKKLVEKIETAGGRVVTHAEVTALREEEGRVVVESTTGTFGAAQVVNCAGLHSDRIARLSGADPSARIVPFRGEYFELAQDSAGLINHLIYPTPDPAFPFLGVHFTRMVGGGVECGPNAVLALAREGYDKLQVDLRDLGEALTYGGFLRLAARHWRMGASEMWRSLSKRAFVRALQRLVPDLRSEMLRPAPSGVRAQAVRSDGTMVDDFLTDRSGRVVNVLNAPSPAATASLNIGQLVVDQLATTAGSTSRS